MREDNPDILIIGGGVGGCAAAIAAAREGHRVVMTEETDWVGGQLTAQGVPPDEHRWIETNGATATYRDYRNRVRDYYRRNYPLTAAARSAERFNPGNGGVSAICHEPKVSAAVLDEMLAPYVASGRLTLLREHRPLAADVEGDRVRSVTVENLRDGNRLALSAPYILDATETGELLPMTGTEYVSGAEARSETGEPHAADKAEPQNIQSCTWCFAMEHRPGEDHTIDKPREYTTWRNYVPVLNPPWTGRQLAWENTHPVTLQSRTHRFNPEGATRDEAGLWIYRRILHAANFYPTSGFRDVCLVNWPQNDYWGGNLYEVSTDEAALHHEAARQLSLSLFYWLQTEAPREDGGHGWPGLRLRGDVLGTTDGLAKRPYIRESRRIHAEFTVLEQHVGRDARQAETCDNCDDVEAMPYPESVGVGYYRLDLHPSTGGDNYIDIDSLRFQIPLGALIPVRIENLLPAAKNIGTTHITNGCYRLHPVEWNIGESAGALAAYCVSRKITPRSVRNTPGKLEDFQRVLTDRGVELAWGRVS